MIKIRKAKSEEEFLNEVEKAIKEQEILIEAIEENREEKKELLNSVRKNLLSISKENVNIYIKNQQNKQRHREINRQINSLLKRIKGHQENLHHQNLCCSKCRFC